MNDPRPTSPYGHMYTVDCLGNVVGGRSVLYNNQPIEVLVDMVVKSIKSGEPVWFGCEVSKRFDMKLGVEDLEIQDFKLVFGVDIQTTLSKADRLRYGESAMTHAMVFTAVSCDVSLFVFFFYLNLFTIFFRKKIEIRKMTNQPNFVWKIHGAMTVVVTRVTF